MSVPGPTLGPCTPWIDGADVAACCSQAGVGSNVGELDVVALEAAMALYEISGRQFTGLCQRTVRPSRDPCSCWGPSSLGIGPWTWGPWGSWGAAGWGWGNECGGRAGCEPLSTVRLSGYPVREVIKVKIDGAVLPATDANGHPNYRLDRWRELVRMDDPGPPYQRRWWPGCQHLALDDSQPGTFSVTYDYGVDPPQIGRDAAAALACQLWLSCSGQACALPSGVTKITRQGITIDRGLLVNWFDATAPTGVVALDLFLRAYWRGRGSRRPAVWSPDVQGYARPQN